MFHPCRPLSELIPIGMIKFSGAGRGGSGSPQIFQSLIFFVRFLGSTLFFWEKEILRDMGVTWLVCIGAPSFLMWHYITPLFNLHFLLPQYKAGPSSTLHTHTITNHFNSNYTPKLLFPSAAAPYRRNSNWFLLHYQGHKTPGRSFQVSVLCT